MGADLTAAIVGREFDLETLRLDAGVHGEGQGFSLLEAVAYVAGESWTDVPSCVCPVIASFGRIWSSTLDDQDRQDLKPYVRRIAHTLAPPAIEQRRLWMLLDWCCRALAPAALRLAGELDVASVMERAGAIVGPAGARGATVALDALSGRGGMTAERNALWYHLHEAAQWTPEHVFAPEARRAPGMEETWRVHCLEEALRDWGCGRRCARKVWRGGYEVRGEVFPGPPLIYAEVYSKKRFRAMCDRPRSQVVDSGDDAWPGDDDDRVDGALSLDDCVVGPALQRSALDLLDRMIAAGAE